MDADIDPGFWPSEAHFYIPMGKSPSCLPTPTLTSAGDAPAVRSVSLILPTFHNKELKRNSLRLVLADIGQSSAVQEVILIVSDNQRKKYEFLKELVAPKPVRLMNSISGNRAKSRNVGAEQASGEFLLFLDDDMLIKHWRVIDVMLSKLISERLDCALFPRRNYLTFPNLYKKHALMQTVSDWREGKSPEKNEKIFDPVRAASPYKTIQFCFPGCFMLIRKEAFFVMKGFKEEFEGWGFEDADFALRAVGQLPILNLFHRSEPLLHIDHPVSPYKSEENKNNYSRLARTFSSIDLDRLCDEVMTGRDFSISLSPPAPSTYMNCWNSIQQSFSIPIDLKPFHARYRRIIEHRLRLGLNACPEYILLHGSRGRGASNANSDFDILALFQNGVTREFFIGSENHDVEIELSDMQKFQDIAQRPSHYSTNGVMELTKLTQSTLLWGDAMSWKHWRSSILNEAIKNGKAFWLVLALGLSLREKYGGLLESYTSHLEFLLGAISDGKNNPDGSSQFSLTQMASDIDAALLQQKPNWRQLMAEGESVFPRQVPEVWLALRWLESNLCR